MTVFLVILVGTATVVWCSTFGYLLVLALVAAVRRRARAGSGPFPGLAVVVPVLNESEHIEAKMRELLALRYPGELEVVVVDGGSTDGSVERVRALKNGRSDVRLLELDARTKTEQISAAVRVTGHEVVLFTDADASVSDATIGALVQELMADPRTGLVGARVEPDTGYAEERLYWSILNAVWWLEGEVFGSAAVSGVCFAVRREALGPLDDTARADDIHVAQTVARRGFDVRVSRRAVVRELRVPSSWREFVGFRTRRGRRYLHELRRPWDDEGIPLRFAAVRFLRLWHMCVTPVVVGIVAAGGAVAAWGGHPLVAAGIGVAYLGSLGAVVAAVSRRSMPAEGGKLETVAASLRVPALVWLALLHPAMCLARVVRKEIGR